MAIDVQGLNKSAIVPFKAGIPVRIGFKNAREQARFFYTHTPALRHSVYAPTQHAIQEFCSLLSPWPEGTGPLPRINQLPLRAIDAPLMQQVHHVETLKQQGKRIIALAPFTMWPSKHWPLEHWKTFISKTFQDPEDGITPRIGLCIGSPAETSAWDALLQDMPAHVQSRLLRFDGQTSFISLLHLLTHVDVLIGPDSAPLHMLDWLHREGLHHHGAKAVALIGPTHALRTGPYSPDFHVAQHPKHLLPCQPCHQRTCPLGSHACLQGISPQSVLKTLDVVDLSP
jgi:heptosyltransferase I